MRKICKFESKSKISRTMDHVSFDSKLNIQISRTWNIGYKYSWRVIKNTNLTMAEIKIYVEIY